MAKSKATATKKTSNRKMSAADKERKAALEKQIAINKERERKRAERLRNLINACLEHFGEDEIVEAFNACTAEKYVKEEDVSNDEMVSKLAEEGYCIFKPEYSSQADQLKEYAQTNVFPYYNIQQSTILF